MLHVHVIFNINIYYTFMVKPHAKRKFKSTITTQAQNLLLSNYNGRNHFLCGINFFGPSIFFAPIIPFSSFSSITLNVLTSVEYLVNDPSSPPTAEPCKCAPLNTRTSPGSISTGTASLASCDWRDASPSVVTSCNFIVGS